MKLAFNTESRFWKVMDRLGDLARLNLLFLLTSLPVITIGASLTAMNAVLFRMQEGRGEDIRREYFSAWKENFRAGTILWAAYLAYVLFVVWNLQTGALHGGAPGIALGICFAVVSMTVFYSFAMFARFENSLSDTVMKAFLIGAMGLPYTIVMGLMTAALFLLTISSYFSILVMASFWLVFGFALTAYICAAFYLRVFRKVTAEADLPRPDEPSCP